MPAETPKDSPVRYEHEFCNVASGAIHLFPSTARRVRGAMQLVKCVDDEGIQRLDAVIAADDIYGVATVYADCVGKLDAALLVFDQVPVLYNETLDGLVKDSAALARRLRASLDGKVRGYHDYTRPIFKGSRT